MLVEKYHLWSWDVVGLTLVRAEMWVWINESTSLLAELLEEVIYLI